MNAILQSHTRRHSGIEWLRLCSMFFITFGQLIGFTKGGMFADGSVWSPWLMPLGGGALDCFILITGYFGVRKDRALSKALSIYVETVFYGIAIALMFLVLRMEKHSVLPIHFLKSAIPLLPTSFN